VDTAADPDREVVLELPGGQVWELAWITIVKFRGPDTFFYKQFELYVADGAGPWKSVLEPPEHPFVGYDGLNNGETWTFPPGTKARRVKVKFVSGYGNLLRIPEIRIYARKAASTTETLDPTRP
jgi:hypothetical protein